MRDKANDGIFDDVQEFPDAEVKRRFERLVGLDSVKERLVKEAMMRLQPTSLEGWSLRHFKESLPALKYFQRRPPLFILAGDVGTGKTELAETFGDAVARKTGITILLHSLSLTARGTGAVGEMTRLISSAFGIVKSQAASLSDGQSASAGHILLIDEADALAQSRESAQMHHEDRAGVNALIRGIDDLAEGRRPVLVVMCTNRLSALDPAVTMFVRLAIGFVLVSFGLGLTTAWAADGGDDGPRREAAECRVRGGLPNLLAQLDAGDHREIRVAYLGGSITAAPGWRVKTLAWLQKEYPAVKFSEINAAIGGTGSDLGVFRLDQDALRHHPDLLLVEFAVNDGGAAPAQIHQAMEGIVRQTWKANPKIDICFVYTLSLPMLDDLKVGKCSRSASAMEELADFYHIPSIHFGVEVAELEKAGKLIFKGERPHGEPQPGEPFVFSTDGVHPLVETGHELYLEAFTRSFERIKHADSPAGPHPLGEPMRADNWEAAKLVPLSDVDLSGQWETLDAETDPVAKRFAKFMPEIRKAIAPGASLGFRFRGTVAGIYDLVGPDCGQVIVSIDNRPKNVVKRIDGYCTYTRLSKMTLASGLDPDSVHTANVTLDAKVPDKATILFEHNRPDLEKNPNKYAAANWYVGSVMLIGELVE